MINQMLLTSLVAPSSISRTQAVSANAASATLSSTSANDLIIVYAYNTNNTTIPSLPAGYTSLGTQAPGGSANASRIGYKVASAGETTTGTWTNATQVACLVYSGAHSSAPVLGTPTAGNSALLSYAGKTTSSSRNWVAGFGAGKAVTAGMNGNITSMTNRTNQTKINGLDTGAGVGSTSTDTLSVTTSGRWLTDIVEIVSN